MATEDGAHFFRQENRTTPTVRNTNIGKCGVQITNSAFQPAKTLGGFAPANVVAVQIAHGVFGGAAAERKTKRRAHVSGDQAGAENDAIRFEQASPQIGQIDGVKRAARREPDGFELCSGQRSGGQRKGKFRHSSVAQAGQFQRVGIGGEQDLLRANFLVVEAAAEFVADTQARRIREVQSANFGVLRDLSASVFCRPRQTGDHFARVHRAARNEADDFQLTGIARAERRSSQTPGSVSRESMRRARRVFLYPASTSPSPGSLPAAVSANAMPPVRPRAPSPSVADSSTRTDRAGASRRNQAAAVSPEKPPPTMAKST